MEDVDPDDLYEASPIPVRLARLILSVKPDALEVSDIHVSCSETSVAAASPLCSVSAWHSLQQADMHASSALEYVSPQS